MTQTKKHKKSAHKKDARKKVAQTTGVQDGDIKSRSFADYLAGFGKRVVEARYDGYNSGYEYGHHEGFILGLVTGLFAAFSSIYIYELFLG